MDYSEAFKNLRTNNKYGRRSPHKAVLLLAIMNLIEREVITGNEIKYNEVLKDEFLAVWNRVLPYERRFLPEAYLPYWYLESESFWHIVPFRGKGDIIIMMRDNHIKPSETKLYNCVDYAELDEDLYFLMTMSLGRSELRDALLSTYFALSDDEIFRFKCGSLNESHDVPEYMNKEIIRASSESSASNNNIDTSSFKALSLETQININFEYYSFLKNHVYDRDEFLKYSPDVYALYKHITDDYLSTDSFSESFKAIYIEFLKDLRISLMSDNGAMSVIDGIDEAISVLKDVDEEIDETSEIIEQQIETENTEEVESNPTIAVTNEDDNSLDYRIVNTATRGTIYDRVGDVVFSTNGNIKVFHDQPYRFNYKAACLTVKAINREGDEWTKGQKILVASNRSDLYHALSPVHYIDNIEDFIFSWVQEGIKIKVKGVWYDYAGDVIESENNEPSVPEAIETKVELSDEESDSNELYFDENYFDYVPKGKLKNIKNVATSSFDFLWMLAIVDLMDSFDAPDMLTFDELACMMIANAWELFKFIPDAKEKEPEISECIDFLIEESKEYMDQELTESSSRFTVYDAIKDYPMAGPFEDAVEVLVKKSPFTVLKAWFDTDDPVEIVERSTTFDNNCEYSIRLRKIDPYITINPKLKRSLFYEHDNLIHYFQIQYNNFLKDC